MSKSIRFLTDEGFENLIKDIQTRNSFEVNANSGNVIRLGKENSDIVFWFWTAKIHNLVGFL